jgi:hypothetical protein
MLSDPAANSCASQCPGSPTGKRNYHVTRKYEAKTNRNINEIMYGHISVCHVPRGPCGRGSTT